MSLTPTRRKPVWPDHFAENLGTLIDGLDAETAWLYAPATFEDAADLLPEEAASIFADELPPVEAP
jgi:uncharacterized protein (DUF2267 family)